MTSLYIAYPHIPKEALDIDVTGSYNTYKPAKNLISGERYQLAQVTASASTATLIYDVGTSTLACDYLILARADLLQDNANPVTQLMLSHSANKSAWTDDFTQANFNTATLYGPRTEDFYTYSLGLSAARYWKVTLTLTSSAVYNFSKVYFGTSFNFGHDPESYYITRKPPQEPALVSSSGVYIAARTWDPIYSITLEWTHLTDAVVKNFRNLIVNPGFTNKERFFLFTTGNHGTLDNKRILHCRLMDYSSRKVGGISNYNELSATFEEVIG